MSILKIVLVIVFLSLLTYYGIAHPTSNTSERQVHLCSKELANLLDFLCNGKFAPAFLDDESIMGNSNHGIGERRKRQLTGVVTECCHKPCTKDHLTQYCLEPEPEDTTRIEDYIQRPVN